MTITVSIHVQPDGAPAYVIPLGVSDSALNHVRYAFNPSGQQSVDAAKLLAAAAITQLEPVRDARGDGGRRAAIAATNIETGAMYAVKALTAGR